MKLFPIKGWLGNRRSNGSYKVRGYQNTRAELFIMTFQPVPLYLEIFLASKRLFVRGFMQKNTADYFQITINKFTCLLIHSSQSDLDALTNNATTFTKWGILLL